MSSPVGHSLAGIIIADCRARTLSSKKYGFLLLCAFIANAPDLDFIPGIIAGQPNLYHHGISHSLGAAVLFSVLLSTVVLRWSNSTFSHNFFFIFALYCSHLFLDFVSCDGRPPFGIPLFWPFLNKYFMSPILPSFQHSPFTHADIGEFIDGILTLHNVYVIGLEILLAVPIALACWLFSKLKSVRLQ